VDQKNEEIQQWKVYQCDQENQFMIMYHAIEEIQIEEVYQNSEDTQREIVYHY
jgi:hypothetical protein